MLFLGVNKSYDVEFPIKCHDLEEKVACNPVTEKCARKECELCPQLDLEVVRDFEAVSFYKWKKVEKYYERQLKE